MGHPKLIDLVGRYHLRGAQLIPEPFHGLTDVLRSYYALDTRPRLDVGPTSSRGRVSRVSIDVSSPAVSRVPPEDADSDPCWAVRVAWLDERRGGYIFLRVWTSVTQVTLRGMLPWLKRPSLVPYGAMTRCLDMGMTFYKMSLCHRGTGC